MRFLLAFLLVLLSLLAPTSAPDRGFDATAPSVELRDKFAQKAYDSTGELGVIPAIKGTTDPDDPNDPGFMKLDIRGTCTGAAFDHVAGPRGSGGYLVLTAAHCAKEPRSYYFSWNTRNPEFELAVPVIVESTEDVAVFYVESSVDHPFVPLGTDETLRVDDTLLNIAMPGVIDKFLFHGRIADMHLNEGSWPDSLALDLRVGPGSSGSPLFSERQQALVGNVVGAIVVDNFGVIVTIGQPVTHIKPVIAAWKAQYARTGVLPIFPQSTAGTAKGPAGK